MSALTHRLTLLLVLALAGPLACNDGPADGEPETGEPEPELPPEIPDDPNEADIETAAALYEYHCQDPADGSGIESADADDLFIYQVSAGGGALVPHSPLEHDNTVLVAVANLGEDINVSDWGVQVVGAGLPPMLYNPLVDEAVDGDAPDMWVEAWMSDFGFFGEDGLAPCDQMILRLDARLDADVAPGTTPVDVAVVTSDGIVHHVVRVELPVVARD